MRYTILGKGRYRKSKKKHGKCMQEGHIINFTSRYWGFFGESVRDSVFLKSLRRERERGRWTYLLSATIRKSSSHDTLTVI